MNIYLTRETAKALWYIDIHTLQNGRKQCGNSTYLLKFSHFPTICDLQATASESREMDIDVAGPLLTQKSSKGYMIQ